MIERLSDFAPDGVETGAGLVIQDDRERYLFILAGSREILSPGELFYAGIGGHLEAGESWAACARREAMEEIGQEINILSAPSTWHMTGQAAERLENSLPHPRPLALFEMIHPEGTPNEGKIYRIIIYMAALKGKPKVMRGEEGSGVIALTKDQVIRGVQRRPLLGLLLDEGAELVHEPSPIDRQTRLYPIGSAEALAYILIQERDLTPEHWNES